MTTRKKIWIAILIAAVLIGLCASPFVAINLDGIFRNHAGCCVSVVFDKQEVMGADKIIYQVGDKQITITDETTIERIAKEFVVANRAGLCNSHKDEWMQIYNGDKLVRSIRWNACDEYAEIYTADAAHWLWPGEYKVGQIEVSAEFRVFLNELMNTD